MKKLIIFFTVLMVCIFSVYPPFSSKAKRPEPINTIQVNENNIQVIEKKNDYKKLELLENLQVIDSLNNE